MAIAATEANRLLLEVDLPGRDSIPPVSVDRAPTARYE